jgi:hypothetical protein
LHTQTIIASRAFFRQAIDFTNDPRRQRHSFSIASGNMGKNEAYFFEIAVFDIVTNGGFC